MLLVLNRAYSRNCPWRAQLSELLSEILEGLVPKKRYQLALFISTSVMWSHMYLLCGKSYTAAFILIRLSRI